MQRLLSVVLFLLGVGCGDAPHYINSDGSAGDAPDAPDKDGGIDAKIDSGIDAMAPDANPEPCGLRVAFQVGAEGAREIWVTNLDGSGAVNISNNSGDDIRPTWSPNGEQLAFQSNRNGNWDIIIVNADGTSLSNLTAGVTQNDERPAWSPDGTRIAFVRNYDIAFMNPDGGGLLTLASENVVNVVTWSPDSTRVVFGGNDGGSPDHFVVLDELAAVPVNISNTSLPEGSASWQPAERIVFDGYSASGKDIFTVAADGTGLDNVTEDSGTEYAPIWAPDGNTIVFTTNAAGAYSITKIPAIGGTSTRLRNSGLTGSGAGEWVRDISADGQWITFERATSLTAGVIGIVSITGTGFVSFGAGGSTNAREPRFSPCL